ncbi:MAG: universal stress protein [Chloroflexi bacterium]|nr:universal stress protein [Chloroflexota bacterium]
MFERILVPLDGSRLSAQALPRAVALAKRFKAEVHLVRVVQPTPLTTLGLMGMESPQAIEIMLDSAKQQDRANVTRSRRYLSQTAKKLRAQRIKVFTHILSSGRPAEAISEIAKEKKVDLVVMTTHGRGGIRRLVLGSVADALVRDTAFPVLAIRPKREATTSKRAK